MRIEKVVQEEGAITVLTTGAKFLIKSDGTLVAGQRIPHGRKLLEVKWLKTLGPLRMEKKEPFTCTISGQGASLTVQGNSLLILKANQDLMADVRGWFKPAYHVEKDGKWLLIDADGGFGVYPVEKKSNPTPDFHQLPWDISYHLSPGDEVWLSVFPPRPYNWQRAFQSIEHEGLPLEGLPGAFEGANAYPRNELIEAVAKYCQILTLHGYIWQDAAPELKEQSGKYAGKPQPWMATRHVPKDMREFVRVRDEVHRNGMKLVVDLSPFYSHAPHIFAEMKRVLDEYQVDGLYFDGISEDFRKSYSIIRGARKILGNGRILYVHCSTDPLGDGRIYCPFIDTYADFILRGEAGRFGLSLDDFLRWTVSGYHISNAVGYWCYYGSNPQVQADYVNHVPTNEDLQAALRNQVRIWRQGDAWSQPLLERDLARFDVKNNTGNSIPCISAGKRWGRSESWPKGGWD